MAGDVDALLTEHLVSWRQYGAVQQRCSQVIGAQQARIAALEAQLMRARAECIVQRTARACAEEALAGDASRPVVDAQTLQASLVAADLVICQTGCLSHGDYWRVQEHCRRTGKTCVLVEQPDVVRIVRLHRAEASAAG